ncbi:MAG: hypothetical protein QNK37_34300 [Acidobacteriota bacterium]|nr:hypothetical protein [Acidobacteriota bacterium]
MAVPLGTTLQLKAVDHHGASVLWQGADRVPSNDRWRARAERRFDTPGSFTLSVAYRYQDGSFTRETWMIEVVDIEPGDIEVTPIRLGVAAVALDEENLNASTYAYYKGESIAAIAQPQPGRFCTSTNRQVTLEVDVTPAIFAPMVEWRYSNGHKQLGRQQARTFGKGTYHIEAGPQNRAVDLDVYSVIITSHVSNSDTLPEGEEVTLAARTDPPGFEHEITWLASSKYGHCEPVMGRGKTFTVRFDQTFGPHPEGGGSFQWLGVKADNTIFNQDRKTTEVCFSSSANFQVSLDINDTDCADFPEMKMTSVGLDPVAVRLTEGPYSAGDVIETEITQLELTCFDPEFGTLLIRERGDRASTGTVTNLVVDEAGNFVSGDSSFDVYVEVLFTDTGLRLDTGDVPARLSADGITALPPLGQAFVSSGEPVPLYEAGTSNQVGSIFPNTHLPEEEVQCTSPDKDFDWFASTGQIHVELIDEEGENIVIELDLSSEGLDPSGVELDRGPYREGVDIATELVRLELKGSSPLLGDVYVRRRADRRSIGKITDVQVNPEDGSFVSGLSSFDVFAEVEIPDMGLLLHTGKNPIPLGPVPIAELPPVKEDYESPMRIIRIPLYDSKTGILVGWLIYHLHHPTQIVPVPSGCGVPCYLPPVADKAIFRLTCINGSPADVTATGLKPGDLRYKSSCVDICPDQYETTLQGEDGTICTRWEFVEVRVPVEEEIPGKVEPCFCGGTAQDDPSTETANIIFNMDHVSDFELIGEWVWVEYEEGMLAFPVNAGPNQVTVSTVEGDDIVAEVRGEAYVYLNDQFLDINDADAEPVKDEEEVPVLNDDEFYRKYNMTNVVWLQPGGCNKRTKSGGKCVKDKKKEDCTLSVKPLGEPKITHKADCPKESDKKTGSWKVNKTFLEVFKMPTP